jgi:hypothetical protein
MIVADRALPSVPDLLGTKWQDPTSLLIVGSTYAPFITGAAGRVNSMPLSDYTNATTWQDFQARFVEDVVAQDSSYYGPLSALAGATPVQDSCAHLAFFDLCRVNFTKRDARGQFQGGDGIVRAHCALYEKYVEHAQNRSWLWQ